MACALCRANSHLRKSHILPEFFYKPIYDSIHRAICITTDPTEPESFIQKGITELLLCDQCEQKIGRWEKYAKEHFVDGQGLSCVESANAITLKGLDYKKFRLFELSLLWRMGVSSLSYFSAVDLGVHEEKLRLALLCEDPLEFDHYPCFHFIVLIRGKFYADGLIPPIPSRLCGIRCYSVFINGMMFCFLVGNHPPPFVIMDHCLNQKGELKISIQEAHTIPFVRDIIVDFGHAIQLRKT